MRCTVVFDLIARAKVKHVPSSIIEEARGGSQEAISLIYSTYQPGIYRFVYHRVNSSETAEDIMQEVFLRMVEGLPRYEDRGFPISAWLYRIAHDRCADYIRRARGKTFLSLDGLKIFSNDWEEKMHQWLEMEDVRKAFAALTLEQQQVLTLRFFEDMSLDIVAITLGRSKGAIKGLQHRAIRRLEQLLTTGE